MFRCGSIDSSFGPVMNPWKSRDLISDDWHIAGGSSGGSACAVATGSVLAYVLSGSSHSSFVTVSCIHITY